MNIHIALVERDKRHKNKEDGTGMCECGDYVYNPIQEANGQTCGLGLAMLHSSKVLDLLECCSSPSEMGNKVLSHPYSAAAHLTKNICLPVPRIWALYYECGQDY